MIKLSPIEIERHEFKTIWRGYDPTEVRAFLGQVSHQLTALLREQERSAEELKIKVKRLEQVEDYENKLRDALLAASQLGEQTRDEARREAELLIKEAEYQADELMREGRQATRDLIHEIESLKRQRERLSIELRTIIESHLRMLENQEEHVSPSRARWETINQRDASSTHFEKGGMGGQQDGDALLEARELTLALGSGDLLEPSLTNPIEAPVLTPSLPEPLSTRPLNETSSRLSTDQGRRSPLQSGSSAQLNESNEDVSLNSGIAKLQRVLSVTPRRPASNEDSGGDSSL